MGRRSETIRYHRMIDAGETPSTKPCAGCQEWLPVGSFGADASRKDGLSNRCRPCARAYYREWSQRNIDSVRERKRAYQASRPQEQRQDHHRKHRYGMAPGTFAAMRDAQGGACAICGREPKRLVVDHSHKTGRVRGLLCDRCNIGLHLLETPDILSSAQAYLELHRGDDIDDQVVVEPTVPAINR